MGRGAEVGGAGGWGRGEVQLAPWESRRGGNAFPAGWKTLRKPQHSLGLWGSWRWDEVLSQTQCGHPDLVPLVNCLWAQLFVIHVETCSDSCPLHHTHVCAPLPTQELSLDTVPPSRLCTCEPPWIHILKWRGVPQVLTDDIPHLHVQALNGNHLDHAGMGIIKPSFIH